MIYPNKHIRLEESIIYKMTHVLEHKKRNEINIHELYIVCSSHFSSIDEFILSLDVLYVLDLVDIDFQTETVRYVKGA
jgi:hypothetical protein